MPVYHTPGSYCQATNSTKKHHWQAEKVRRKEGARDRGAHWRREHGPPCTPCVSFHAAQPCPSSRLSGCSTSKGGELRGEIYFVLRCLSHCAPHPGEPLRASQQGQCPAS